MKKLSILLLAITCCLVLENTSVAAKKKKRKSAKREAVAQRATSPKATLKEWKKRKKAIKPLQLKDLIEENHRLKALKKKYEEEIKAYRKELEEIDNIRQAIDTFSKANGINITNDLLKPQHQQQGQHIASGATGDKRPSGDDSKSIEQAGKVDGSGGQGQELMDHAQAHRQQGNKHAKSIQTPQAQGQSWSTIVNEKGEKVLIDAKGRPMVVGKQSNGDSWAVDAQGNLFFKGLLFKVQIGAYRKRDLSNVLEDSDCQEAFEQEQDIDIKQYTIRHFRSYWNADRFKKELRAMGLKDAWIVAFKDGKRVPLKVVLEEVLQEKRKQK